MESAHFPRLPVLCTYIPLRSLQPQYLPIPHKKPPGRRYKNEVNQELIRGRRTKPSSCSYFCQYTSQELVDYRHVQLSTTLSSARTFDSRQIPKAASNHLFQKDRQIGTIMTNIRGAAVVLFIISSFSLVAGSIVRRSPAKPTKLFGSWGQLGAFFLALTLVLSTSSSILLFLDMFWGYSAKPIILSGYWEQLISYFLALVILCTSSMIIHQLCSRPRLSGREDAVDSSDWTAQPENVRPPPRIHSHSPK